MTGQYLDDVAPAAAQPNPTSGGSGVAPYAIDPTLAARLWDLTVDELGS